MNKYKILALMSLMASILIVGSGCSSEAVITTSTIQSINADRNMTEKSIDDDSNTNQFIAN